MTNGQLVKILQGLPDNTEILFSIGDIGDEDLRLACAKTEIVSGQCLEYLEAQKIIISADANKKDMFANVILTEMNWKENLFAQAKVFDSNFKEIEQ